MANKTAADLAIAVLKELRVIRRQGSSATAAQSETVKDKYTYTLKELRARNAAYWDEDSIPEEAFDALTKFMAGICAPTFGRAYDDQGAFDRLKVLASVPDDGEPVRAEYM